MKYVSIDIETTGLNSEKYQILSFGAIVEDTEKKLSFDECPKFYSLILRREIIGEPRAILMNAQIIKYIDDFISNKKDDIIQKDILFLEESDLVFNFYDFLWENGFGYHIELDKISRNINGVRYPVFNSAEPLKFTVAGKNYSTFDKLFLEKIPNWKRLLRPLQRVIDPSVLYVDWKNDNEPPNLNECKKRANIEGEVSHVSLYDAWDVIKLLRKFY